MATRNHVTAKVGSLNPRDRPAGLTSAMGSTRSGWPGPLDDRRDTIWTLPETQILEPEQNVWKQVVRGIDWAIGMPSPPRSWQGSRCGRRATIDELYTRGRLLSELFPGLLELQERHGVKTFFADPSEPAYIEHCRRAGLRITEATNDVLPGIDALAASIKAARP